jgi:ATP-dependent DNA helicase RecG
MPVYREILGISSEWIAEKMSLLRDYFAEIPDLLPRDICRKKNFLPKEKRLRAIHAPENPALFERARYELAYEELFAYQYA